MLPNRKEESLSLKKVLLIDGHSIANRAFYGVRGFSNSQGVPTNALFGFINTLLKTTADEEPTHIAVAFDQKEPTFRHQLYKEYKGTRKPMPDELHMQIPMIQDFLRAAGIPVILEAGIEADDILGSLAKQEAAAGAEVMILTGDRDLLQLADDRITILLPHTQKDGTELLVFTPEAVKEHYGVTPQEFIEEKALMGDASDNIPGVPSIGEKTASQIIQKYHTVEEAIRHASEIKPPKAAKNLTEFADQARLSLVLATIKIDAEIGTRPGEFDPACFSRQEVLELLKKYEMRSLLAKFTPDIRTDTELKPADTGLKTVKNKAQKEAMLQEMGKGFAYLLFHKEPEQISLMEASNVYGLAVCTADGGNWWIEEDEAGLADFRKVFEDPAVPKTGHDVKWDMEYLAAHGIGYEDLRMDTMIAAYLLNPSIDHYGTDEIAQIFLDRSVPSDLEIFGTGKKQITVWDLDADKRAAYGSQRAAILAEAAPVIRKALQDKEMEKLFDEIELPLIPVLASMESYGIRVDRKVLEEYGKDLDANITQIEERIYQQAGETFNILSPKQLGEILFEKLLLPAGKKTKTGYSTSADVLEKLAPDFPIVQDILRYRQLTKLKSTYVDGLYPCIRDDGKIHSRFNQTVTATGRLSSSDPNLQNIPIRTELGRQLRRAFVPSDESYIFTDADYSQIELRLLASMSGDEKLIEAYRSGEDIHRLTASQVLGIPPEKITAAERSSAKAVNFGIIYGISAFALSDDLHISQKQAKEYIEKYYRQYPQIRDYLEGCVAQAKEKGYGVTLFGRRRVIDELKSSNFAMRGFGERVAKNMPIQGTAADIMKIAMIRVFRALKEQHLESRLLLTVHDELLIETKRGEEEQVAAILQEGMTGAADLAVPLTIEIQTGEDWYHAK